MILEVKQIGKYGDVDNKSEYGEYTMFPGSARSYVISRGLNGKYKTGLEENPEKKKELEYLLGANLDPTSPYWDDFRLTFRMPTGSMKLNTENPLDELFTIVAKANFLLAPDRETLKEDYNFKKNNTIFYIHDEEALIKRKSQLEEIKGETTSLIYQMRNNKEKMLFVAHSLGMFVTESFKVENLYAALNKYKDKLTTFQQYENLRDVLKRPNEELQAAYFVKQGLKHSIIVFDSNVNKYKFQEKHIGRVENDLQNYFKEKKNEADLAALIIEIKDKEK